MTAGAPAPAGAMGGIRFPGMPTPPRVNRNVLPSATADRGVALLLFLAVLVVGVLASWDAPEAYSQAGNRNGRRASGQGSAGVRAGGPNTGLPSGWTYSTTDALGPVIAVGHGGHDRPPMHAPDASQTPHSARRVVWHDARRPARRPAVVRALRAPSDPLRAAPSARAPPVA